MRSRYILLGAVTTAFLASLGLNAVQGLLGALFVGVVVAILDHED